MNNMKKIILIAILLIIPLQVLGKDLTLEKDLVLPKNKITTATEKKPIQSVQFVIPPLIEGTSFTTDFIYGDINECIPRVDTNSITRVNKNMDYTINVRVKNPSNNYCEFTDDFTLDVIGMEDSPYYVSNTELRKVDSETYEMSISYYTEIKDDEIYSLYTQIPHISVGLRVDKQKFSTPSYFTHNRNNLEYSFELFNITDNKTMKNSDIIEYNKEYYVNLIVSPKEGYKLNDKFLIYNYDENETDINYRQKAYYVSNRVKTRSNNIYIKEYRYLTEKTNEDQLLYGPIVFNSDEFVVNGEFPKLYSNDNRFDFDYHWENRNEVRLVESNEVIEEDTEYWLFYNITPKNGRILADYIDCMIVEFPDLGMTATLNDHLEFDLRLIELNTINFSGSITPAINHKPSYYTLNMDNNTRDHITYEQNWYHNNTIMNSNDVFLENEEYEYRLTITPNSGYKFNQNQNIPSNEFYNFYIDGNETMENNEINIYYKFKMVRNYEVIDNYEPMRLPDLVIGKSFPFIENVDYRLDVEQIWFEYDDKDRPTIELAADAIVEKNKKYGLSVLIKEKEGYQFEELDDYFAEYPDPETTYFVGPRFGGVGEEGFWTNFEYSTEKNFDIEVESIHLNKSELNLKVGEEESLNPTIVPNNATDKTITWTSSNTSIATVDANGKVKALKEGTVTITATTNNDKTAICTVNVTKEETIPFTDVKPDYWFYEAVKYTYEHNIIKGYNDTTFAPDAKITRGQLVTILWRMENEPDASSLPNNFKDVGNDYFTSAIKWANSKDIVHGYNATTFGPNKPIIRQDLAVILFNYAKYKELNTTDNETLNTFADYNKVKGSYAEPALSWAVYFNIISGKRIGDKRYLSPSDSASRAETAAMITNLINTFQLG